MSIAAYVVVEGSDPRRFFASDGEGVFEGKWFFEYDFLMFLETHPELSLERFFSVQSREEAQTMYGASEVSEQEAEGELRDGVFYDADGELLWQLERHWHDPKAGVAAFETLIQSLQKPENRALVEGDEALTASVVATLRSLQNVIKIAQKEGRRFHLASTA